MDLDALRFGNFSRLGEAITDWEQMTKKLADLKRDAENNLKNKAVRAKWSGVNANVTREFVDKTAAEFADAHTQADSIAKILKDTRSELIDYRTQLNDAIERGARHQLTVVDTGDGTFMVSTSHRPDWSSDPSGNTMAGDQRAAETLRDDITRILGKATESDNSAAKVLKLLVDQAKYGFSDAKYGDRDSAARAVAAAEKLAKMAKDPDKMTLDEIADFNRTMAMYRDDSLFSEQFARGLGPKGTLQFWTEMAHAHAGARGSELEAMKSLQKNLGLTLATASFSDSEAMQEWKKNLIAESNTNFRASTSLSPIGALGSQVISSLMRQGQYDTEFLDNYRDKLFKADKGAGESNTDALWVKGYDGVDLVFGDGNGRDPLEGLFVGLSHNPEAAVHAFESKSDLDHMLETTKYTDRGPALGHALEAAVTGVVVGDSTAVALPHSEEQVAIMANITHAIAQPDGGAGLVTKGMGESFGHMAASYMPEISLEMAGKGAESIFITDSAAPDGLNKADVTRFLYEVSRDNDGRAAIIYGESIYTSSLLEAHIADPSLYDGNTSDAIRAVAENAGVIEGVVGHSVADAEIENSTQAEKDYNDSIKSQGDFFKTVISTGVGVGSVALVPATPAGAITSAAVGGFFGGVSGMAIDRLMEGKEIDGALDDALYRTGQDLNKAQDSALQQTQWAATDAIAAHNSDLKEEATQNLIRESLNSGWSRSDQILEDIHARPSA
ncbi:hypothetical protein K4B79_19615 [Streptomyces lincolnensis]|uniref:hypothetical protein n=1 Tax=Streptomyces lincolnensis TaxID=1915 RepID=UPI001E318A57|nr:hypothetical protein [Streptomyces lincolnensis]MCD7440421.1 hypothetical protein [Streptomyces lincolnensis]